MFGRENVRDRTRTDGGGEWSRMKIGGAKGRRWRGWVAGTQRGEFEIGGNGFGRGEWGGHGTGFVGG